MRIADMILPEDRVFYELFRQMTGQVKRAGELLHELAGDLSSAHQKCHEIRQLEHDCDGVVRRIYERLDESLITPLEPEEIARLAGSLDDVVDHIDWVSHQICSYGISEKDTALREFSELILKCVIEIERGVENLSTLRSPEETERSAIAINRYWNSSRNLLMGVILDMFKKEDPILIIKFKDVYENLEEVLARCNSVGHVLSEITRHHA